MGRRWAGRWARIHKWASWFAHFWRYTQVPVKNYVQRCFPIGHYFQELLVLRKLFSTLLQFRFWLVQHVILIFTASFWILWLIIIIIMLGVYAGFLFHDQVCSKHDEKLEFILKHYLFQNWDLTHPNVGLKFGPNCEQLKSFITVLFKISRTYSISPTPDWVVEHPSFTPRSSPNFRPLLNLYDLKNNFSQTVRCYLLVSIWLQFTLRLRKSS